VFLLYKYLEIKKEVNMYLIEREFLYLVRAIFNCQFELATQLIDSCADISKKDPDGSTLLHIIADNYNYSKAYEDLVEKIFEKIDQLGETKISFLNDAWGRNGRTALIHAIHNSNILLATKLIDEGADIRIGLADGGIILHVLAESYNNSQEYKDLVAKIFEKIDLMAEEKISFINNPWGHNNTTPLIHAINHSNILLAIKLIDAGADISVKINNKLTILNLLSLFNYTSQEFKDLANKLIEKIDQMGEEKMDFLNDRWEGMTALMHAIKTNKFLIATQLILTGADISIRSSSGVTILDLLAEKDNQTPVAEFNNQLELLGMDDLPELSESDDQSQEYLDDQSQVSEFDDQSQEYKDLVDIVFDTIDIIKKDPSKANFICEIITKLDSNNEYLMEKVQSLKADVMQDSLQNREFVSKLLQERSNCSNRQNNI
jgi:ankyrin repeat protein